MEEFTYKAFEPIAKAHPALIEACIELSGLIFTSAMATVLIPPRYEIF